MEVILNYIHKLKYRRQEDLVIHTHEKISSNVPHCQVSIRWNVPYYRYYRPLCYINTTKDYIYVGFIDGGQLEFPDFLDKKGIKRMAKYYIRNEKDLNNSIFLEILFSAMALQEED